MPRRRLVSALALVALAAAVACDSFGSADSTPANVTPEGGAIGDGGVTNPEDGDVVDGAVAPGDGLYPTCPPTSTGSKFLNLTPRRIVRSEEGEDYPFGIVTDTSNVYWVSQFRSNRIDDPYDGHAKASIHRASKTATDVNLSQTILVDGEAAETVSIALDGEYIYWAAVKNSSTVEIRRVARTCVAPCLPDVFLEAPAVRPIQKMRRGKPGLIFAMTDQGQVLAIDTENKKVFAGAQPTHANPSLAALADSAFVSWLAEPKVWRARPEGVAEYAELPAVDGGGTEVGGHIATDCTRLFVWRKFDRDLWSADVTQSSAFDKFASAQQTSVYDAFADKDYVYLASADGFGISVIDIATRNVVQRLIGSYWRVWADDTGLYAGDHSKASTGEIYVFGQ